MEAQGEQLLQNLVDHEKALAAKVEEARAAAKAHADEVQAKTDAEAETARSEILSRARSEVETVETRAANNRDAAVKLVVESVLP